MPFFLALLALVQPIITWFTATILPWMFTTLIGIVVTRILLLGAYFIAANYAAHSLLNTLTENLHYLPSYVVDVMNYFGIITGLNIIISAILFKKTLNLAFVNAVR